LKNSSILLLTAEDIKHSLTMLESIELMNEAFIQLSGGTPVVPLRTTMPLQDVNGNALIMPVYVPGSKKLGIKTVTVYPENPSKGHPAIQALFILFDAENGAPLAIMNGEVLTALRTGAASGLASKLLAKEDAKTLVVFGTGAQAETQIEAVCTVRDIQKIIVTGRDKEKTSRFAKQTESKQAISCKSMNNPEELLEADIICTATTANEPVFEDRFIRPGCHINGIGSFKPTMREIPAETIKRAKVVVDSRKACLAEAGDIIQLIETGEYSAKNIHGELGEICSGKASSRISPDEITVFKSVGNAVQDLVMAAKIFSQAVQSDLGKKVNI
jgi:ornithine cyclodeaminase/alanine dehydrogenase-like protein (mu-crystallin family)